MTTTAAAPDALAADDDRSPSWIRWVTVGSIAAAAIGLGATVWSVGPRALAAHVADIGVGFVVVLALEVVVTGLDAAGISGFLGAGGRRPSYWFVLRAQVIGRAINAVTPLASLGEVAKASALMERTSSTRAIGAVLRYNLTGIGLRLLLVAIGAPLCALILPVPGWLAGLLYGAGATAAVILVVGAVLIHHGMLGALVTTLRALRMVSRERAQRWRARLAKIDRQLRRSAGSSRRQHWRPIGWLVASRIVSMASLWTLLAFTGRWVGPGVLAAIVTAGQVISTAAAVVPLGLGVSEAGNAALFAALGEPASLGVAMVVGARVALLGYAALGLVMIGTATVIASRP